MRYTLEKECFGDAKKQAIFLVPGWAMPKECLRPMAQKLSENYYVVLINLPGVSLSSELIDSKLIGPNYDIDALSEQLITAAPEEAFWVGWSLGGMIATYVAARRSSKVKGLITIASTPAFVQKDGWDVAMPNSVYDEFSKLVATDPKAGLKRFVALQTAGAENASELRQQLSNWVNEKTSNPIALSGGLRLLKSLDVRRELEILDVPSLHVFGANDELVDSTWLKYINNELYPLNSVVLDGMSHQPFMENLTDFIPHITQFINGH
ncbi:alpha/beta fold hydrolase [Marinomonas agarivorans]|nr:alpha/beta fold hydrolase [Marinomonas agarivorans]